MKYNEYKKVLEEGINNLNKKVDVNAVFDLLDSREAARRRVLLRQVMKIRRKSYWNKAMKFASFL